MKIITGDMFELMTHHDAVCIPTNGVTKRDGRAVMGAGLALAAKRRWPHIDEILGECLTVGVRGSQQSDNNDVYLLFFDMTLGDNEGVWVCSFPTKHGWKSKSDMGLIVRSTEQLVALTDQMLFSSVIMPAVGCGLGGLLWDDVRTNIEPMLDDRFTVCLQGVR